MSRVAEVISTERDAAGVLTVRCDPGGGAAVSAEHFAGAGDDSVPLPGDFAALEDSTGTGAEQVTGYHDATPGVAQPGEVRRYARAEDGEVVAELWLKRDGSVELRSLNGLPLTIRTTGPIVLDSPDVRISDSAGAGLARVGDMVVGSVAAIAPSGGGPIIPGTPPGVPFAGQIVSGSTKAKA